MYLKLRGIKDFVYVHWMLIVRTFELQGFVTKRGLLLSRLLTRREG